MIKEKKKIWLAGGFLFFVVYFFAAARVVPPETVLVPRWLSSLESGGVWRPDESADTPDTGTGALVPFSLGSHFGYVDSNGRFSINRVKKGEVYLSPDIWSEYEAQPESIEIRTSRDGEVGTIRNPSGYPCFLDGRIFLLDSEQNALSELDPSGEVRWTYEFAAPLTCIDAAAGLVLTGSIDGVVEVLDRGGNRVFFFEPGGSRYAAILGCAISRDGSRLGIISGVRDQRFLMLERFGGDSREYKVVYHEFLDDGFRRPVYINFINKDRWLVFERQGGIGLYELNSRRKTKLALRGEVAAVDLSGESGLFFVITTRAESRKELVGVRLPGGFVDNPRIVMEAPFKGSYAFLNRSGSLLIAGGGSTLAAFELEKK